MNNSAIHSNIVNNIFLQNEEFVLFGLTGRVRSGQDDVVDILTSHKLDKLRSTSALGGKHNNDAERENNIILRYLLHHWRPFIRIHVSAIMMSFLLEACSAEDNNIILDIFKNVCCNIFKDEKSINRPGYINIFNNFSESLSLMIHLTESQTKDVNSKFVSNLQKELEELIKILTENDKYLVNMITFWKKNFYKALTSNSIDPKLLIFCFVILPYILECFKISIDENKNDIDYIVSMQKIGNSLRAHGKPFCFNEDEIEKCIDGKNIFCIALRVNNIIKILRNTNYNNIDANFEKNKVLILIDDFKNVYEILFFRKRYSAFYLLSISTDDESRRKNFNYDEKLYQTSSLNETPNVGQKKYEIFINAYLSYANDKENINNANINNVNIDNNNDNFENNFNDKKLHVKCKLYGLTEYEIQFCMQAYKDKLRRHCYLYNLHSFILQDIIPCVENADIFINNNYHKEYNTKHSPRDVGGYKLCLDILRYVTLVFHPALLTPTSIERCMQLAMAAKLNSGCLSRQVGAVVTDKDYNILSLGWNDSPCGTVSCIRRNFYDLKQKFDPEAYSEYELNNKEFRNYIENWNDLEKEKLVGLPGAFCFKDVFSKISGGRRDQIYTRALHGEERALAVCGFSAKGGFLFTTSSPCELCAKRAKDVGIVKIYYIEQFTGISESHVMEAGQPRAEYELFSGATGLAYTKLYTPIIPYKDELNARGFNPAKRHFYKEE